MHPTEKVFPTLAGFLALCKQHFPHAFDGEAGTALLAFIEDSWDTIFGIEETYTHMKRTYEEIQREQTASI